MVSKTSKLGKGKVVPAPAMKVYGGRSIAPFILHIGTRWREWSASNHGLLSTGESAPQYSLNKWLDDHHTWRGSF